MPGVSYEFFQVSRRYFPVWIDVHLFEVEWCRGARSIGLSSRGREIDGMKTEYRVSRYLRLLNFLFSEVVHRDSGFVYRKVCETSEICSLRAEAYDIHGRS